MVGSQRLEVHHPETVIESVIQGPGRAVRGGVMLPIALGIAAATWAVMMAVAPVLQIRLLRRRFCKPSDGLEPSTPSLPSSGRGRTPVQPRPRQGTKVQLGAHIAVDCSNRLRSAVDRLMYALSTRS